MFVNSVSFSGFLLSAGLVTELHLSKGVSSGTSFGRSQVVFPAESGGNVLSNRVENDFVSEVFFVFTAIFLFEFVLLQAIHLGFF